MISASVVKDLIQVKRDLTSTIINFGYEFPHELPNNLRLRKLENIMEISKFVERRA